MIIRFLFWLKTVFKDKKEFTFYRKDKIVSEEKDESENPLLVVDGDKVKIRSLKQASNFMKLAKNKKILEAKACLDSK